MSCRSDNPKMPYVEKGIIDVLLLDQASKPLCLIYKNLSLPFGPCFPILSYMHNKFLLPATTTKYHDQDQLYKWFSCRFEIMSGTKNNKIRDIFCTMTKFDFIYNTF